MIIPFETEVLPGPRHAEYLDEKPEQFIILCQCQWLVSRVSQGAGSYGRSQGGERLLVAGGRTGID